LTGVPSLYFSW